MVRTRLSSSAGQVAAEYVGGLLLIAVVIGALLHTQVHTHIAVEVERAICKISGSANCGEPGVPKAQDSGDDPPGKPDREVHDAECSDDLPGKLLRGEGDKPSGDPEADKVYENLGQVFKYYADTFGRDSYDDAGGDLIASINFCEDLPGGALRDMADPANGDPPQPDNVKDFVEMPNDDSPYNDHGGVHYNSGIPNHAYYLMVKAMGRDKAEAIVYRALTEELKPDSGFEDFRTASLAVARKLWGEDSPEYQGTNESFAAVGLDGTWEAPEVEGC